MTSLSSRRVTARFIGGVSDMFTAIRLASLLLGCALTAAPSFLGLMFAYGVGEPPEPESYLIFFGFLLAVGLVLGLGPLLIGLPGIVAGATTPQARIVAGLLLGVSAAMIALLGMGGSVTRITSPAILLLEAILFAVFVWPAKPFSAIPALQRDAPQAARPRA